MVKHIILWTLKDEYTEAQKKEIRAGIKEGLEGLKGQIPGMIDISVRTDYLPTSTVDVMLDTTFEDADALAAYAKNPKHVAVADTRVRPFTANRHVWISRCNKREISVFDYKSFPKLGDMSKMTNIVKLSLK